MGEQKKKKDKSYFLGLLLLLLSGFFVYLFFAPEQKGGPAADFKKKDQEFESKVNQHLFSTSQRMELQRKKMEIETEELAGRSVSPGSQLEVSSSPGVDFEPDPRHEDLVKNLGRGDRAVTFPSNPNDLIQMELFQQDQLREYSEEYKKEYARQFVENARRGGYEVKLNGQYKIISVMPIRKPAENFNLFDTSGSTAR